LVLRRARGGGRVATELTGSWGRRHERRTADAAGLHHGQSTAKRLRAGRNPEHAAVAVTTGLLQRLNKDELAGVFSHELGHIKHRDTLLMTIAAMLEAAHRGQDQAAWGQPSAG
jgi:hypothetical protein